MAALLLVVQVRHQRWAIRPVQELPVTLTEAASEVLRCEREVDRLEMVWLGRARRSHRSDEQLRRQHLAALQALHHAVMERDKLKAQLGVHPYLNLVQA